MPTISATSEVSEDFVFIIPEGWTQVVITPDMTFTMDNADGWASTNNYFMLTEVLRANNILTEDQSVLQSKVFNKEVFIIVIG